MVSTQILSKRWLPLACSAAAIALLAGCSPESEKSGQTPEENAGETEQPRPLGTPEPPPDSPGPLSNTTAQAFGLSFGVPDGWRSVSPSNQMRAVEFRITGGESGEDATAYVSGGIRGGVEQNIQRWIGQISEPEGEPEREQFSVGDLNVSTLAIEGTFSAGGPMMGGGPPEKGTLLLGAVIQGGPEGTVFVKATGPAGVLRPEREAWRAMLESVDAVR